MPDPTARTARGEHTRALILETALELFRERGYEETTMRAIAARAGVALGSAYYYFRSKEQLVQAFYGRVHEEHRPAALAALEAERDFRGRLHGVMRAMLEAIEPYHRFAGVLFRTAADPESPLNPFSAESLPARRQATALFAQVVAGAEGRRLPADLERELPDLLWIYHMGVILFWIHDRSPGRARTWKLMDASVDLVARLVSLSSLPLMGPLRKAALRLLVDLRAPYDEPSTAPVDGDADRSME